MLSHRIVHIMPDGTLRITTPATKVRNYMPWFELSPGMMTLFLNQVAARTEAAGVVPPEAVRCPDCLAGEIPQDRKYRAAWRINPATGKIHVDQMEKARLEAIPKPLTLEERLTALEAKQR